MPPDPEPATIARDIAAATGLGDAQRDGLSERDRYTYVSEDTPDPAGPSGQSSLQDSRGERGLLESLNPIGTAQAQGLTPPKVDLLSEELRGGHTLEKHVGKTPAWLDSRLSQDPIIPGASTYRNLDEATAVTQQVLDLNRSQIAAWIADPAAGRITVASMSRPITSPSYKPIGTVVDRRLSVPVPGNGARVVLQKNPGAPTGFTVITSFPTFSGIPTED
jgi:hypothetical protein